jgi:hypothetical protein
MVTSLQNMSTDFYTDCIHLDRYTGRWPVRTSVELPTILTGNFLNFLSISR